MGALVLHQRAYYHCPTCHGGHCPADLAFGLGASDLTAGAEQLAVLFGTTASFAEAAERLLPKASGLRLAESTIERATEAAGLRLGQALTAGATFGVAADWDWPEDARGRTVAYVSVDATGVPIQGPNGAEAEGRMAWVGKVFAPRPEAKVNDAEAKANDAKANDATRRPATPGHARYLAGLTGLDELGDPLRRQAAQVGMDRAQQWVALSDCGSGVDDFLRVNFPRAVRIADFYHVAEHLGELAKAWHPGDPEAAQGLSDGWCHTLKHEGGRATLSVLEALDRDGRSESAREVHRQVRQYLENHADRMDYPTYVKAGWQIGLGHIEAACKTVVNERLKRSGMRWGEDGADAVCHLRALFKGDAEQWEAFWNSSIN
jgi:hypothetical protein